MTGRRIKTLLWLLVALLAIWLTVDLLRARS